MICELAHSCQTNYLLCVFFRFLFNFLVNLFREFVENSMNATVVLLQGAFNGKALATDVTDVRFLTCKTNMLTSILAAAVIKNIFISFLRALAASLKI